MRIFFSKYFFLVIVVIQLCLWLVVKNDPFFGDAVVSTSLAANHIFDEHLSTIFYPIEGDPGHPTLFPYLMAMCWQVFGKSLPVSHACAILVSLWLAFVFRKITKLYIQDEATVNKTLLLLCFMPTFVAQSAMMLGNLVLIASLFTAIYGLLSRQYKWLLIGSLIMMVSHLQGSFFLVGLAIGDCWLHYTENGLWGWVKQRFFLYAIPFLLLCTWLGLHYLHTGWFVNSPSYDNRGNVSGLSSIFKNLVLIGWRLVDFGMLPFYGLFAYALLKRKGSKQLKQLWVILTVTFSLILVLVLQDSFGHRYFLGLSLLMIVIVADSLRYMSSTQQHLWFIILLLSLLAGNFIFYPGKNLGDGTLAYRGYFKAEQKIKQDFADTTIFYGYAPIANSSRLTHLSAQGLRFKRITGLSMDSLPVIIQSNVNAEFSEEDKAYLQKHFYGKSYQEGYVYVNVFLNPTFYQKPSGWELREPSAFELWLSNLKNKLNKH